MEISESVKIIEKMMADGRKSVNNYSSYFIIWGTLLLLAAVGEFFLLGHSTMPWMPWPIAGVIGGVISSIVGRRQKSSSSMDRIIGYTWLSFGICLVFSIFYSLHIETLPHTLILLMAGGATFISGGISGYKALFAGGLILLIAATLSGFIVPREFISLIFAAGMLFGYLIPGIMVKMKENVEA